MQQLLKIFLIVVAMNTVPGTTAGAADTVDTAGESTWQMLRDGDALILMRHALAPGTGDPDEFKIGDCSTQRNLSNEGRMQASRIGEVLRDNGIKQATVLSSEWCRCQETARLLELGDAGKAPMLNSFYQDRSTANAQTSQLRSTIKEWIGSDKRVRILVTHQVNISALTGQFARSGEMLLVTLDGDEPRVVARVPPSGF